MLIIAQHQISNPDVFWTSAKELTASMPAELKIHSVFPSKDMKTGTCIWEANSADAVQKFLDDNVGNVSKNFCYEINEEAAMGLPKEAMEAQHN